MDIDNVNILRCPASLGITFNVVDETRSGAKDGSIGLDVLAGLAPFTYKWSNDATTKGIRNLEAGTYQVTVSDAIGCSETIEIQVGRTVAVQDIDALVAINLAPNPSSGQATLFLTFQQTQEVEVLIFNTIGQLIQSFPKQPMKEGQYELQLNGSPEGLYFVQVAANGQVHTQRLLLVKD
ncbi:MAG: T9SS type A sorting domain-containing protein [Saprospiraceae bacterium]|nr:T9SS type A sorting domain-containing protein [Saprospiraceae bacterium]